MITERRQSDLGALSREWFERVKDIRQMAREANRRPDADHAIESATLDGINIAEILPDSDLFAAPVYAELESEQVFAGPVDMDLFTVAPEPAVKPAPAPAPVTAAAKTAPVEAPAPAPAPRPVVAAPAAKRSNLVQKVVAASLLLIAAVLIYGVVRLPSLGLGQLLSDANPAAPQPGQAPSPTTAPGSDTAAEVDLAGPVSLGLAENDYVTGHFSQAAAAYKKLLAKISANPQDIEMRDFLRLRHALCLNETAGSEEALRRLEQLSQSPSPTVRMLAHFHSARLQMEQRQYLAARANAYRALALIDTVDEVRPWRQELRRNSAFLVAASMSQEVLSLSNASTELPPSLWKLSNAEADPFAGLEEDVLRPLLAAGSEKMNRAILGPRIQPADSGHIRRWMITSDGASAEELLSRFAAHAGYDIRWTPEANKVGIRRRVIRMHLPAATDDEAIAMMAGCAGLLAVIGDDQVVSLYNPDIYEYTSEQVALLGKTAIALWRTFALAFHEDRYLANVHFALGKLYAQQDMAIEAMAEYKIVANRFLRSPLAPAALFHSGRLKADLRDYAGAQTDMRNLVEQYPDCPLVSQGYLALAEMLAKRGRPTEAADLYRKIYYLNASGASQAAAALAAGDAYFALGDYESAQEWLARHIELKRGNPDNDLYQAYYLLGKTRLAMGQTEAACAVLQKALAGQLPKERQVEAVTALVEGCIELGHYLPAFDVLEETYLSQFSQADSVQLMILKSRLLRAMGLADKAVVMLNDRLDYVSDRALKTAMGYELAQCFIDQNQYELAFKELAQNLAASEPGPIAYQNTLLLARVSLKLGRDQRALTLCSELLRQDALSDDLGRQAREMVASIHRQQKNYDNAALVLMGQVQ